MDSPLHDLMNDWYDWWRALLFLICVASLVLLGLRYFGNRECWNEKTKDYWYSMVMWTLAGLTISIEGVVRDSPLGVRLVIVTAASLVSLKALAKKGPWGGSD